MLSTYLINVPTTALSSTTSIPMSYLDTHVFIFRPAQSSTIEWSMSAITTSTSAESYVFGGARGYTEKRGITVNHAKDTPEVEPG